MKHYVSRWLRESWWVYGCGAGVIVLLLVILLMGEAYFFWAEARALTALKDDYANYILGFKRAIADTHRSRELSGEARDSLESKKKMSAGASEQRSFIPVVRDPGLLYAAGLAYARSVGIEEAWTAWHESVASGGSVRHARGKRRRTRHNRSVRTPLATVRDLPSSAVLPHLHLIWPIDQSKFRITSPFGPRRIGLNGPWGFHHGLDMAAPFATPVKAVAHGVVIEARWRKGFGKTVVIAHSDKVRTRYAHLSAIDVAVGDTVEQGQRIGRVGNTGNTRGRNGVHLHLEVLVYGKRVNPMLFYRNARKHI